jgi:hypothetical protein
MLEKKWNKFHERKCPNCSCRKYVALYDGNRRCEECDTVYQGNDIETSLVSRNPSLGACCDNN